MGAVGDEDCGPGIFQNEVELRGGEVRIDVHHNGAQTANRQMGQHPRRAIGEHQRHARLPRHHPLRAEPLAHRAHALKCGHVGQTLPGALGIEAHKPMVGTLCRRHFKQIAQGIVHGFAPKK